MFNGPEDWSIAYASWSPDGSRIAITVEQYHGTDSYDGNAILLTMARDGSNNRVLVRFKEGFKFSVDSNEPWDGETGWVWRFPIREGINPASTGTPTPAGTSARRRGWFRRFADCLPRRGVPIAR